MYIQVHVYVVAGVYFLFFSNTSMPSATGGKTLHGKYMYIEQANMYTGFSIHDDVYVHVHVC